MRQEYLVANTIPIICLAYDTSNTLFSYLISTENRIHQYILQEYLFNFVQMLAPPITFCATH